VFQSDNETGAAPDLNIVTIHKTLGLDDGLAIVATDQWFETNEVPICVNDISPIFLHRVQSKGRSSPLRSLATSGDRKGFGTSQSVQRNLRPPVLTNMNFIGFLHFVQLGGGVFLGM
jgi:hypothetical protein